MAEAKTTTTKRKTTAKKTTAKKTTARKTAAKKDTSEQRTTKAQKAAPLKAGATAAAATTEETVTGDIKEKALTKARSAAESGKDKTSEAIGNLSKMIEDSAQTIDENVGEKYGDYARSAADAVANFSDKLSAKEIDEMVEDARGFVRKSPAVAIGAAAVVGFLISRLIKSGMDDNK